MSRPVYWHESIPSTMVEAARLAAAGCAAGTIVAADEQTAGQGRLGRSWYSAPGNGLYLSYVARVANVPARTLAAGLAARAAIEVAADVTCDLRWPNDLLVGNRKCGGILVNAEPTALIVGIGINLNHEHFPPELAPIAISLRQVTGRVIDRHLLLNALAGELDDWMPRPAEAVIAAFERASSYARGRRVTAEGGLTGITAGLDEQGFLLIRQDDGKPARVVAGDVRPIGDTAAEE